MGIAPRRRRSGHPGRPFIGAKAKPGTAGEQSRGVAASANASPLAECRGPSLTTPRCCSRATCTTQQGPLIRPALFFDRLGDIASPDWKMVQTAGALPPLTPGASRVDGGSSILSQRLF